MDSPKKSKEKNPELVVLGARLKKVRLEKKLTLEKLAYSISKDAQSISRVEMGNLNPTYLYLLDLAKGLDMDIVELIKRLAKEDL